MDTAGGIELIRQEAACTPEWLGTDALPVAMGCGGGNQAEVRENCSSPDGCEVSLYVVRVKCDNVEYV